MNKARIRIKQNCYMYMAIYTDSRYMFANIVDKLRTIQRPENEIMIQAPYYYIFGDLVVYNCY
jgi:hypothetical protein